MHAGDPAGAMLHGMSRGPRRLVVAADDVEGARVVGDVVVLVDQDAGVDRQPVPGRLVLEKDAVGLAARDLVARSGVASPVARTSAVRVARGRAGPRRGGVHNRDRPPAVRRADQVFLVLRERKACADVVGGSEEVREVRALETVLVAEEVLIVLREVAASDALPGRIGRREDERLAGARDDRRDEAAGEIGRRRVERALLERDEGVRRDGAVVLVVVEAGLEGEPRVHRPEGRADEDAVDRLGVVARRRRHRRGDVLVRRVDPTVAKGAVDQEARRRVGGQLAEILVDVVVTVGHGAEVVDPFLLGLPREVRRP